ncbi:sensor histidine kinase [Amycolatopsis nigrescens]|uniref:sensor histidine kinase n=1 Tax=Amycolatopsis nigrescens TaxID=381445 RepID=UPI000368FBA5|nr:HAMP domain-containing sensor histidine kinase [Amycolatopsis nigrescens]
MKLFPATLRGKFSAVIMLVTAAAAVGLSLLVHGAFARTQLEQARELQDERLQVILRDHASTGQAILDSKLDDPALPPPLRAAVLGGNRATYLDESTPDPGIWAAADVDGRILSLRSSYADQTQALAGLDQVLVIGSVVVAVAGALLGIVIGNRLSRRLRRAAEAAGRVAAGDPARVRDAIGTRPQDETADLAQAVDAMADALQARLVAERRVTADIAHELRTPVTGLVTAAELLPPGRPAELVRDRVSALRSLVEDVLEVARLDTATEEPDRSEVALGEFVRRRAAGVVPEAEVRVITDAALETDPRRLERVLVNLMLNARRHGAPPIEIEVDGGRVALRDHGPGLPDTLLREGPSRFRTGDTNRPGGHGLGLTIAAAQAKVLGGTLLFANAPDGGALVTFELPPPE